VQLEELLLGKKNTPILSRMNLKTPSQCRLSLAEVITIGLTSSRFFGGNLESARAFLAEHQYIPNILSKSRLNRRLHAIPDFFWHLLVEHLCSLKHPECNVFLVDSFPVAVCHNVRSSRRALFRHKSHVGYNASKKSWFTGLKVHILTTHLGQPMKFFLSPASEHDLSALRKMYLGTLPKGATLFGDKAYTSKDFEDEMLAKNILIAAERRSNSSRGQSLIYHRFGKRIRKRIETTFSRITSWLPRKFHAVSDAGFLLKLRLLIAAFALSFLG